MTVPVSPPAAALIRAGRAVADGRHLLTQAQWAGLAERLATDPLPLAGLWSDGAEIHALLVDQGDTRLIASVAVERQRYQALSPVREAAIVPERMVRDLWGFEAMAARDLRPWLDHGAWGLTAPLLPRPGPASWPPEPIEFLWDARDEAVGGFQLPIGPVQTLTIGPAQFRLTLVGERIRRIEPLFGSAHRGVALALRGLDPDQAIRLVARIDATSSVAHQLAFARAVEAARGRAVDRATEALRRAMAALERIAMDLHHLARLWSLSGHPAAAARAASLRALLLPVCAAAFGDRLMMTSIAPGGWASMPDGGGLAALPGVLARIAAGLDPLPDALPGQDRLASIERDLTICGNGLDPVRAASPPDAAAPGAGAGEALGMAESVQGPVWHWLRLQDGLVGAWHAVDPTLERLRALTRQVVGLDLEQLTLACAAAGLSVAGADQ